jgi:O-antigen/teichoic acid export membrane protein
MLKKFLPQSEFSRNVFTLVKGTSIAQLIPMAMAPILARIYTPEELGAFAYLIAIVSILSVVVTGRYEMAILLPRSDDRAVNVLAVSITTTVVFCLILLSVLAVFFPFFSEHIALVASSSMLFWLLPLTLLLAIYQGLYYWYNRRKEYKLLSQNRVLQNATTGLSNILLGVFSFHLLGLVLSRLIGYLVSLLYLLLRVKVPIEKVNKKEMKELAIEYQRFPKYLIFAHTLNAFSLQLPVFLITTFFGALSVGFFSMAQRVIMTPLAIISNSLGDVFRQEASEQYAIEGQCVGIYLRTLKKLVYISFLPFLIFYFLAPWLFGFVFGDDWLETGTYAQLLTFLFFMQFITRPLTNMFLIAQKQRADAIWQIALFSSTLLSFLVGYMYFNSVFFALGLFSISRGACYLYALIIGYYFSKGEKRTKKPY